MDATYYTPANFSAKIGLSRTAVYYHIKMGRIRVIRIDGKPFIDAVYIDKYKNK